MRFPLGAGAAAAVCVLTAATCSPSVRSAGEDEAVPAEAVVSIPRPEPVVDVSTTSTTSTAVPAVASGAVVWTLLAGGDVLMDRSEAAGHDPFAAVRPTLAGADIAVVNAEMAISDRGQSAEKRFVFRAPPSAAATMALAGIDAASLANNHAGDYGTVALLDSVEHLRAAGVAPVGAGADSAAAYAPATFSVGPLRIAVVAASRVLPDASWAAGSGPGIASAYDHDRFAAAVGEARATHDVVVAMVHWGTELAPCPVDSQVALARALLDAGAAVVVGSHPHVLQPVVIADGAVVAYSLGNFAWHATSGATADTGVLEVRFRGAAVDVVRFHPHVLDGRGAPVPATPPARERILAAVERRCGEPG